MGFSISLIGFKGLSDELASQRLGLRKTSQTTSFADTEFSGYALPKGWFLIAARGCDSPLISSDSLTTLSVDCEVVACSIEEHVMYVSAELWKHGRRIWRIAHNAQMALRDLETEGDLPPSYAEALSEATKQQDAEDAGRREVDFFFEIPLAVTKDLIGFKHDEQSEGVDDDAFTVFEPLSDLPERSRPSKWWQIWK
jgi:hypothetical protein